MSLSVALKRVNDWNSSKIRVDRFCADVALIATRESSSRFVWFPSSFLNQEMDGDGIPVAVQLKVTAVCSLVTYNALEVTAIGTTGERTARTKMTIVVEHVSSHNQYPLWHSLPYLVPSWSRMYMCTCV